MMEDKSLIERDEPQKGLSGTSIGIGIVVDVFGSMAATRLFVLGAFFFVHATGIFSPALYIIWTMIIGLAGLCGGAYLAGRLAKRNALTHASIVVALDLFVSVLQSSSALFSTFFLIYVALALPVGLLAGKVAHKENQEDARLLARDDIPELLT